MRLLFVSHRFPYPPTFGSKVRAFNMIRHLAREHQVSVFSLARSAAEEQEAAGIAPHCHEFRVFRVHNAWQAAKIAATLPSTVSASEAFFHSRAMQREIDHRLATRSFDFIVGHCSAVGRYVEQVDGLPKLMDFCDVDSLKWRDYSLQRRWPLSLGYRWEAWRMEAAERRIAACFDQVTVATPGELAALERIGVRERADWVGNGVDLEYFAPVNEAHDPDLVTFVGRMDYYPNEQCMVDFCRDVWPALRQRRPGLRLQIVGAEPTPRVKALAAHAGVSVTGAVPDVRPYVRRSALTIAPLRIARGTQNKILESLAMGVPVVASRMAAGGVDALPGEHLLAADTPAELTEAILRVAGDARLRARLAEAGRERMLSHHDWPGAMRRLDAVMARCLARVPSGLAASAAA